MKKKSLQKILSLNREVLRTLTSDDLSQAGGALTPAVGPIHQHPTDPVPWLPGPIVVTFVSR